MALKFATTRGTAAKGVEKFEVKDGENQVRLVGDILARYVYWIKLPNGKDVAVECLSFDRDQEKFLNAERDWVPTYFPEKKCSWAYTINCIDPKDNKVKVFHLKKKLLQQILLASEDLGDPTNLDTGWTVVFKKEKDGPLPINVSYSLQVLRCKKAPLTPEQKKMVEEAESIDDKFPRMTSEQVKDFLDKATKGDSDDEEGTTDDVAKHAAELVDDIPQ